MQTFGEPRGNDVRNQRTPVVLPAISLLETASVHGVPGSPPARSVATALPRSRGGGPVQPNCPHWIYRAAGNPSRRVILTARLRLTTAFG